MVKPKIKQIYKAAVGGVVLKYQYLLRPHHGMCIAFFQGKGYSDEFTAHMSEMIQKFQDASVCVSIQSDAICQKCPNNLDGKCKTDDKVISYDEKVLDLCGLTDGEIITYKDFCNTVYENIISAGKRENICGDCQWNEMCK